ncbi:MAG: DUF1465 family protein [Pseudomonadota bacterium]
MSEDQKNPVRLAEHFAASQKFAELFSGGMDLVEETASFLDGEGRAAAKGLSPAAAGLYGAESMRLTTRLMQLASWLLLQRAVGEGEMSVEQVIDEKKNVRLDQLPSRRLGSGWDELPSQFISLIDRSIALQKRVRTLDDEIYRRGTDEAEQADNPVASQHALLETAFDLRFRG